MSPSKESESSIKAGADLLLKGWKMLNKACPTCAEPLYEKAEKVVCVKCKKQYKMVNSSSEMSQFQKEVSSPTPQESPLISFENFDLNRLPPALAESARIMLDKLSDLNKKLKDTTDLTEISEISSSIRSLIESLRSLNP